MHSLHAAIKQNRHLENFVLVEWQASGTFRMLQNHYQIGCVSKQVFSIYALEVSHDIFNSVDVSSDETIYDDVVLIISNVEVCGQEQRR